MNLSGLADITARNTSSTALIVYPHNGTLDGTSTLGAGVVTSYGWHGMNWIGPAHVTLDAAPDVLSRTHDGRLFAYPHSGVFDGTNTLQPGVFLGFGWNLYDLLYTDDLNGDGLADLLGRQGDQIWYYLHSGTFNGTATYLGRSLVLNAGASVDTWENMSDVTGDGLTDLIFRESNGWLGIFDFEADGGLGEVYYLSYGWNIHNALLVTDINGDGWDDIVARHASNGVLYAYPHSGSWNPGNPLATFQAPVLLGYNWHINDIIT